MPPYTTSSTPTAASILSTLSSTSQTAPIPSPSRRPHPIDFTLVLRNVVLQKLDFLLQLPNLLLNLRLGAVRGALAGGDSLLVDDEETAALGSVAVAVGVGVESSLAGVGGRAGAYEGGRLGFAAAFEGEDVVEAHA